MTLNILEKYVTVTDFHLKLNKLEQDEIYISENSEKHDYLQ